MSSYTFTAALNDVLTLSSDIASIAKGGDQTVAISFGTQLTADNRLLAVWKVMGSNSTLTGGLLTSAPEDMEYAQPEGTDKKVPTPVTVAVKASEFIKKLNAALRFKADMSFRIDETGFAVGIESTGSWTKVPTLKELPVEVKASTPVLQLTMPEGENARMLKHGLSCVAAKGQVNGVTNGVLTINGETGVVRAFGMDGTNFSVSTSEGKLPEIAADNAAGQKMLSMMNDAMAKLTEKSGGKQVKERLEVLIPFSEIGNLKALTSGATSIIYAFDETHVSVQVDRRIAYTFTQASARAIDPDVFLPQMEKMSKESGVAIEVDAGKLAQDVGFHMDSSDEGKTTVDYIVTGKSLHSVSSDATSEAVTVTASDLGGKDAAEFVVNGALLKNALSDVEKGNLVLQVGPAIVLLKNGTLAEPDSQVTVGLAQVNKAKAEAPKAKAEETPAESEEASEPEGAEEESES